MSHPGDSSPRNNAWPNGPYRKTGPWESRALSKFWLSPRKVADFCLLYKQALYLSIAYIFPKNYMRDWSLSSKVLSWGFYIATKECLVTDSLVLLCVNYLEEIKTIVLCLIWQEQCPPVKFLNHYNYVL